MAYTDLKYKFKKYGKNVEIGDNVYFRYPHLVEIGDNVIIDEFSYFTTSVVIGNNVHIAPYVSAIGGSNSKIIINDFCSIAAGVRFVCRSDNFYSNGLTNPTIPSEFKDDDQLNKDSQIYLNKHVIIGTNTVILPNVTLGEGVSIGAMSFVRKDLKDWGVYVGNPIKNIGLRDEMKIKEEENKYLAYLNIRTNENE